MSKLILLNITDSEVSAFIQKLQALFSNKKSTLLPHITLRGPYKRVPSRNTVDRLQGFVNDIHEARIDGVDMFANGDEYFVYFKVHIPGLESVSWKRDFPIKQYGFNPHITILKTRDRHYAEEVLYFLNSLNIQLQIRSFDLEVYQLGQKQVSLLSQSSIVVDDKLQHYLSQSRRFVERVHA